MAQWRQFVGSYNAKKVAIEQEEIKRATARAANEVERKRIDDRRVVINDLVARLFWQMKGHRRSQSSMAKAYDTADFLAHIGGDDYQAAIDSLNRSKTWFETNLSRVSRDEREQAYDFCRSAYADACACMLIPVND
jgi:hypothetical protein